MSLFAGKKSSAFDYEAIFRKLVFQLESLDRASETVYEILKSVLDVVGAQSGSLYTYQPRAHLFVLQKWVGERPLSLSVAGDFEFLSFLKQTGSPLMKEEVLNEPRYLDLRPAGVHYFTQLSCMIAVPLLVKGAWAGVLNIGRSIGGRQNDRELRELLITLGLWLGHHVSSALLYEEVRATNRKLKEITELKNQLMANVTHELRTPLNGILGLTGLILEGADGPVTEDQKRHLEMIKAGADSLREIVENILSLVAVEARRGELPVSRLPLAGIVEEVADFFQNLLLEKRNSFQTAIDRDLTVYGNEDQIRTVFMNVIGNAVKFTQDGQIEVRASRNGEMVRVSVKDTGIGISEEDQDRVFDDFFQGSRSHAREHGGTGLGLSVAKKILEIHGGRIWVDSVQGKGSEFTFTLPIKPIRIESTAA